MKTRLLLLSCLVAACSATSSASPPTSDAFAKTTIRMNVSKFQPGEERDSLVKEIGEPDLVSDQANGERREVYSVYKKGQETLRHRSTPLGPKFYVFGDYYVPPNRWEGADLDLNHFVVLCYESEKLIRVIAKPCPSAACLNAPSSPNPGRAPAGLATGKSTPSPSSQNPR